MLERIYRYEQLHYFPIALYTSTNDEEALTRQNQSHLMRPCSDLQKLEKQLHLNTTTTRNL